MRKTITALGSIRRGRKARARQLAVAVVVIFAGLLASISTSTADDTSGLYRQLATSADFRLRVGAALSLGRMHAPGALDALVHALDDTQPAVRAAAAAALGALGNRDALEALDAHLASESSQSVTSQIRLAIDSLNGAGKSRGSTQMLVKLGELKNLTGVRGAQLVEVFRGSTRRHMAGLPGVEVVADNADARAVGGARKLPVVMLDGVVNRMTRAARGGEVTISAQVEYVVSKLPERALKGSVSGSAQAIGSSRSTTDGSRLAELENQALSGAVASAMQGAPSVLESATR